jgi:serine/threonine protein kinase
LTRERWAQIEELFHRAAECEPERRTDLLDEVCSCDPDLRREVEALLCSHESAGNRLKSAVRVGLDFVGFPLAGETVSHYRIIDGLGEGGMGQVYRAEDIRLGRPVALKLLPDDSSRDPAALGRFEREARSASALDHPNICPIYEFGEHDGRPFIAMQLLDGQTLHELIATTSLGKPPLRTEKSLDLAIQILDGLDAAHQKGIIHRDIKPANIFVTSQGQAKILDFGLAKPAPAVPGVGEESKRDYRDVYPDEKLDDGSPLGTLNPLLSRTGVAIGTAGYMSPEQARGETLDARTDLFSFGLVLYEMATGQRAFKGDTVPMLHEAILNQVPTPARKLNPELPQKLEKIIERSLEKDRDARYQSALDIRADLRSLRHESESKLGAREWMIAASVLIALLVGSAAFWFARLRPTSRQSPPELKLRQLTVNSFENHVLTGAISPDGKYLAYSDMNGIRVQEVATGETRVVPPPEEPKVNDVDWEVLGTWFPDGAKFVVNAHPASDNPQNWSSQGSSIWLVSVIGGPPSKIRENATAYSVSPDGSLIAFGTNKGRLGDREIWLMDSSGGQARKVLESEEENSLGGMMWSSDGNRILYYNTDQSGDTLLSRDLSGGPATTVFGPSEMTPIREILWQPDGRLLYSVEEPGSSNGAACNFWGMRLDAHTGVPIEKPRKLTNWSGFCMSGMSGTADGKQVAFLKWSPKETSFLADLAPGANRILRPRHFPLSESSETPADWMPDSKGIFFLSDRSGHEGIYRQFLDQDIAEPVVTEGYGRDPSVTPDGKSILYLGPTENGAPPATTPQPVMRVSVTGGPSQMLFVAAPWSLIACARSPSKLCVIGEPTEDGKQMAVSVLDPMKGRGSELFRFTLVANDNTWYLDLSPDGTQIAATRTLAGPIYLLSLNGQVLREVRMKGWNNLLSFVWAADGKGLFVTSGIRNGREILHVDLQGNAQALWEDPGGSSETLAHPSPDGRHLAFNGWDTNGNMWSMRNF